MWFGDVTLTFRQRSLTLRKMKKEVANVASFFVVENQAFIAIEYIL